MSDSRQNLNPDEFGPEYTAQQLPGMEDLGMHAYPSGELRGTARNFGDPYKPLYRRLSGVDSEEGVNTGSIGLHWTHDAEWAMDPYSESDPSRYGAENEYVIEAEHPGREHVMTWESDKKTMDVTVGPEEYDGAFLPEVPIRPGAPMKIRAIHRLGEWNDDWTRERSRETWRA